MTEPKKPGHILNQIEEEITGAYTIWRIMRADLEHLNDLIEDGGTVPEETAARVRKALEHLADAAARVRKALEHLADAAAHLKGAARVIRAARREQGAAAMASLHAALGNLPPGVDAVSLEDPAALHDAIGRAIGEA